MAASYTGVVKNNECKCMGERRTNAERTRVVMSGVLNDDNDEEKETEG